MARAADNLFHKAEQAIKRRNFDYAIELLLQGLKLDPLNVEQRKRLRQTEVLAIQSKGGNPKGNWKTSVSLVGLQFKLKKLAMAKKWEEQVIEIENFLRNAPQHVGMLFQLANAFKQMEGGTQAAIETLQEIVEADRTQVEAWRQLGTLYAGTDPEMAIKCWEKVRQYKPDDKEASKAIRDLSASTMVKKAEERRKSGKGDFTDLLADEEEAKKLQEEQHIIRTDEDARRAIQRVKEKLEESPNEKRLLRQLADLHRRLKEYDEAKKIYEKLLELDPNDLLAKERLGDLEEYRINDKIAEIEEKLKEKFNVGRAPFGWYKSFKISCKGHPLSELSREITAKVDLEVTKALEAEEKIESYWYILTPDGKLIDVEEFDFTNYENLKKFDRIVINSCYDRCPLNGIITCNEYVGMDWDGPQILKTEECLKTILEIAIESIKELLNQNQLRDNLESESNIDLENEFIKKIRRTL